MGTEASRLAALVLLLATVLLLPSVAEAYPRMIRHGYTACAQCHVDPSGAGALTEYGRAQAEILLPSRFGRPVEDPGKEKDFLFGWLDLPPQAVAQVDVRGLVIPRPGEVRAILMQADLRGGVDTGPFVAMASAGVVSEGARPAWIAGGEQGPHLVSRDYWVGVRPSESTTVRVGRMALPFGIRDDLHVRFTRAVTRTSLNADQQVGLAVAGASTGWRGELMAVAGNPQVSPDVFRERGYSGFFALAPSSRVEIGLSSLLTSARLDVADSRPRMRQAHGAFARVAPTTSLGLFGEVDVLLDRFGDDGSTARGVVADLHADLEPVQGLHVLGGAEACGTDLGADAAVARGWAALQWFFHPRVNLRVDAFLGPLQCVAGATARPMGTAQLHVFL